MSSSPKRRAITGFAVILAALLAIPIIWFVSNVTTVPDRQRPDGVPQSAFWQGGVDGGFYFHLVRRTGEPEGHYYAEIYNDFTGTLEYRGMLVMQAPGDPDFDPSDPGQVNYWNGDALALMDGRVLLPTTEFDPNTDAGDRGG